jgi:hypothetical protein
MKMEERLNKILDKIISSPYSIIKSLLLQKKKLQAELLLHYSLKSILDVFPEASCYYAWETDTPSKLASWGIFDNRFQFFLRIGPVKGEDMTLWYNIQTPRPESYTGRWYTTKGGNLEFNTFEDGVEHGLTQLRENGLLVLSYESYDGKMNGRYEVWHTNGHPYILTTFRNGLVNGSYKSWHPNSQYFETCFFKNGKKCGIYRKYNEAGVLINEISYMNDVFDGVFNIYDDFGKIIEARNYSNGEPRFQTKVDTNIIETVL